MSFRRFLVSLILAVLLGLALSENAFAQESRLQTQGNNPTDKSLRSIEGTWNLRLQQMRFEDDFNQKTTTEFRLLADLSYKPIENVRFHLAPKFTYTNGFVQVQEVSQANKSEWGVKDASINASFFQAVTLSAGAINQGDDHPALLMEDQAFPALKFKFQTSEQAVFSTGFRLETAVPTSSSLSTQTREFEKTPSYNSGSLNFKVQKTLVEGELKAGAYQFQNLPSSVATASTYLGNSTRSTTGGSDSVFVYEFEGPFVTGSLTANLSRSFRLLANADWLSNAKAPAGFNQGLRSKLGAEMDLPRGFMISPFYEYFKIEPDAAVALYNSAALNTNRVGYQSGLALAYRKVLKVTLSGGERDVIYTTPFQMRERTWNLKLETLDVAI